MGKALYLSPASVRRQAPVACGCLAGPQMPRTIGPDRHVRRAVTRREMGQAAAVKAVGVCGWSNPSQGFSDSRATGNQPAQTGDDPGKARSLDGWRRLDRDRAPKGLRPTAIRVRRRSEVDHTCHAPQSDALSGSVRAPGDPSTPRRRALSADGSGQRVWSCRTAGGRSAWTVGRERKGHLEKPIPRSWGKGLRNRLVWQIVHNKVGIHAHFPNRMMSCSLRARLQKHHLGAARPTSASRDRAWSHEVLSVSFVLLSIGCN